MKTLSMALAGALLLAAASALADNANVVRTQILDVKERLQHLERIDVTAEKPANPDAEPLDDELRAILDEAERAERAPRVERKKVAAPR
jgi:hypothetical protein